MTIENEKKSDVVKADEGKKTFQFNPFKKKYCPQCGAQISNTYLQCPQCRTKLKG